MTRPLIRVLLAALVTLALFAQEPIPHRGFYYTFCRMPTFGLAEWKQIYDRIAADGGNLVLLWIGGGFRSKKFPITWQYNRDHRNIQQDFVRELIDYGHRKGLRTLLGFTPFSYDGVNQYPIEHPELKATQRNGRLAGLAGIHCWGYAMNPSRPAAQQFMLDYIRELFFDFYPNADGLMIESSDYAVCHCSKCQGHYYEREFQFVRRISEEVWKAKPDATILVYPHYFSGKSVPGFNIPAARLPFDPRWTLFFTPHSAHLDPDLIRQAKSTIYWDTAPALRTPREIQEGARQAVEHRMTGYVPTFESFSFRVDYPEGGERFLIGKRLKPFGFEWLADGVQPYDEPLVRANRVAYREFTRNPQLGFGEYKLRLGADLRLPGPAVDDLLFLQQVWFAERSWFSPSPVTSAALFKEKLGMGSLTRANLETYRGWLPRVRDLSRRYAGRPGVEGAVGRVAEWISSRWTDSEVRYLSNHLTAGAE